MALGFAYFCLNDSIFNCAVPIAAVCRDMIRVSGQLVIGLCEQWTVTSRFFAKALIAEEEELELNSVGTNHLTWALGLRQDSREVLDPSIGDLPKPNNAAFLREVPVSTRIYQPFGLWPPGTAPPTAVSLHYFPTRSFSVILTPAVTPTHQFMSGFHKSNELFEAICSNPY